MERPTRKARTYLTFLKWILVLSIPANLLATHFWFRWVIKDEMWVAGDVFYLLSFGSVAALMLDSLQGGRIANMVTRGMAVLFIGSALGIVVFDQASQYTEFPYAPMLIVSFGVAFVGAVFYVWSARATPGR